MIKTVKLHNFKNHLDLKLDFGNNNLIVWPNWSWKTNILEAIYLLANSYSYNWVKLDKLTNFFQDNFIVSFDFDNNFLLDVSKVAHDFKHSKTSFIINLAKVSRNKYLEQNNYLAVFFSPIEINIIYLWPGLRRDFLDEVCFLYDKNFLKIKSDYSKILKNRNVLLRNISEQKAKREDLKFWNSAFVDISIIFYQKRKLFLDYINDNISTIEKILENKYSLSFEYKTKVDFNNLKWSICDYLEKNIERDIITGHTYIGPHLDDFVFYTKIWKTLFDTSEILSRWENKSILIWLKFLELEFLKTINKQNIIILLDDIFSELDDNHIKIVLDYFINFQTFITHQNIPNFLLNRQNINIIRLN